MKCNLSKNNHWVFATGFILIILGNSCIAGSDQASEKQDNSVKPYTEGIRIGWDYSPLTRVNDGPVSYPRHIRLQNGDLLCAYESLGCGYGTRSPQEGSRWHQPELAAASGRE